MAMFLNVQVKERQLSDMVFYFLGVCYSALRVPCYLIVLQSEM